MAKSDATAAAPPQKKPFSLTPVYWGLLALYAILVFYGVSTHEPWRDEAQSWLLTRDLSFTELLKVLPAEGHPPLWYLIIMPFAKMGAPYLVQNLITAAIMVATVYLLLFKTRLPIYLKIAIIFSYFFLYEYAIVARSYCLCALFVTLIVALYPQRFSRPWLFALAVIGLFNSQMLAFTFAASVAGMYAIDAFQQKQWNKNTIGSFIAMVIGGAYLIPYIVLSSRTADKFEGGTIDHSGQIAKMMKGAFFSYTELTELGIALILILAALLITRPKALLILLGGLAGVIYILGYKYVGGERHFGLIFLCVLGAYGIAYCYNDDRFNPAIRLNTIMIGCIVFTASLLMQVSKGIEAYKSDIDNVYSDAKGAAEFIKDNGLSDKLLVGNKTYAASALLPFLPAGTKIFYPDCQRYGSYVVWDECAFQNMIGFPNDYAAYITDSLFANRSKDVVLILSRDELQNPQLAQQWQKVYGSDWNVLRTDERFIIYRHK